MRDNKENLPDKNNKKETALSKVRGKLNRKVVVGLISLATLGAGTFSVSQAKDNKEKQKNETIQKNRQAIKEYWQELYPTADEFIFNEKEDIYAAIYRIPEDLQKDLAVECDYINQTRKNIEQRLKLLQEAKALSAKGFRPVLTSSEQKEYVVLEKTLKKLPYINERHELLARYGNIINMVDFNEALDKNYGAYNDEGSHYWLREYRTALEGGGFYMFPFTFGEEAKRGLCNDETYKYGSIEGKATDFTVEAIKNMQISMKNVEKELSRAGLRQYLGKRNPDIVVTQRNINFNQPNYWEKMTRQGDRRFYEEVINGRRR